MAWINTALLDGIFHLFSFCSNQSRGSGDLNECDLTYERTASLLVSLRSSRRKHNFENWSFYGFSTFNNRCLIKLPWNAFVCLMLNLHALNLDFNILMARVQSQISIKYRYCQFFSNWYSYKCEIKCTACPQKWKMGPDSNFKIYIVYHNMQTPSGSFKSPSVFILDYHCTLAQFLNRSDPYGHEKWIRPNKVGQLKD